MLETLLRASFTLSTIPYSRYYCDLCFRCEKVRHRKIKQSVQGHMAGEQQSQNSNQAVGSVSVCLTTKLWHFTVGGIEA